MSARERERLGIAEYGPTEIAAPVGAAEAAVAGTVRPDAVVKEDEVATAAPIVEAETPRRPYTPAPWSSSRHSSPAAPSTPSNAPSSSAKGKAKSRGPLLAVEIPIQHNTPAPPPFTQADVYATSAEEINVRGVAAGWLAGRARRNSALARSPEGRPEPEAVSAVAESESAVGRQDEQHREDEKSSLVLAESSSCSSSSKSLLYSPHQHITAFFAKEKTEEKKVSSTDEQMAQPFLFPYAGGKPLIHYLQATTRHSC